MKKLSLKARYTAMLLRRVFCGIFLVLFIVLGGSFIGIYYGTEDNLRIIAIDQRVFATYYGVAPGTKGDSFSACYKYVDENGVKYFGAYGHFNNKETAVQLVGRK